MLTGLNFRYKVYRLPLVLIDNLRVDLNCANVAVAEKLGDSVEVCSVCQGESDESVTADVVTLIRAKIAGQARNDEGQGPQ